MIVPKIPSDQLDCFSFILSQSYKTSFEIESIGEENGNFSQYANPDNGIDILNERVTKEILSRIFKTQEDYFPSIVFNAHEPSKWCHIPTEWKGLMQRVFSEEELRAIHAGDNTFPPRDVANSHGQQGQQPLLFQGGQMQQQVVLSSPAPQIEVMVLSLSVDFNEFLQRHLGNLPRHDKEILLQEFEKKIYPEAKMHVTEGFSDHSPLIQSNV